MDISGTCPMLYAFFDGAGRLRREAVATARSDIATPLDESWARRFAAGLGPLPA